MTCFATMRRLSISAVYVPSRNRNRGERAHPMRHLMPTKPVIFDIENPRGTLPGASRKTPGSARELSLPDFRYALVSTRFESAKIAVFAIFLFSTVAFAAHASHLTNPDNSFAANSGSAIGALKTSVRSKTTALASATMERMEAAISHMEVASKPSSAPVMVAQVQAPAASRVRRVRHFEPYTGVCAGRNSGQRRPHHESPASPCAWQTCGAA